VNARFKRLLLLSFVTLAILLLFLRLLVFTQHGNRRPGAQYHPSSLDFAAGSASEARSWSDSFGDGTPDFLRLSDPADREVFRRWFTLIADYQAVRPKSEIPAEVTDCAGLLRYAYREALKRHNDSWFLATGIEIQAPPGEIRAWLYPNTPLKMGLFRVQPGPFEAADVSNGAFAQFADARTLVERNAFHVSRDVRQAQPGDLLFFRQFGQSSPWHSMIVTRIGAEPGVVYHTGPDRGAPGEIRRVTLAELLDHPDARWRPISSNPNFLGVYRWNILRGNS
jgi:uncharacterized protein YfaT (DUF1175 family)